MNDNLIKIVTAKESLNILIDCINDYIRKRNSICGAKRHNHKLTFKTCKKKK